MANNGGTVEKGSKARCTIMMSGSREEIATRLQSLGVTSGVVVGPDDHFRPFFPRNPLEPELGKDAAFFADPSHPEILTRWWLGDQSNARTPNWDIASTCTVDGRRGLLLVEAKAHVSELSASGKSRESGSDLSRLHHETIQKAIAEASGGLNEAHAGFALTHDSHYQLANRFAWAWKLTMLGTPVVLVYLGFLNAEDMAADGYDAFATHEDWRDAVISYGDGVVPSDVWGAGLTVGTTPLRPLIVSQLV